MSDYGVIQEQGDLGLGFSPITEDDKTIVENSKQDNDESNEK